MPYSLHSLFRVVAEILSACETEYTPREREGWEGERGCEAGRGGAEAGERGRTRLLLAIVLWPVTTHPFRVGASGVWGAGVGGERTHLLLGLVL